MSWVDQVLLSKALLAIASNAVALNYVTKAHYSLLNMQQGGFKSPHDRRYMVILRLGVTTLKREKMLKQLTQLSDNHQGIKDKATLSKNVEYALVKHVYHQTMSALLASMFCASLIFIDLYNSSTSSIKVMMWGVLVLAVTFSRIIPIWLFKRSRSAKEKVKLWKAIYITGSFLGGISWGYLGAFLFVGAGAEQQVLMILMLAGVSAGSVPLSAAVPAATIAFLITAMPPFIYMIFTINDSTLGLFVFALILYTLFMFILTARTYRIIKDSVVLKYEKDSLLKSLERTNLLLEITATHDPLTGAANRTLFSKELDEAMSFAASNHHEMALMFIDLDTFKASNDFYGHHIGDKILQVTVERLNSCLKDRGVIARLGGDEFAIIIRKFNSHDELREMAHEICKSTQEPIGVDNHTLQISVSVGVSIYPDDGLDQKSLLSVADKSMYQSKSQGGNRYTFSSSLMTEEA